MTPTRADTDDGPALARAVVVATDGWAADSLLGGALGAPAPRGVTTVYHATPAFPEATGMLLLEPGGSPVANSIAISVAAPQYAPAGQVLVSTSVVHGSSDPVSRSGSLDVDGPEVRAALARLHRTDTSSWRHVATYDLPHALPGMPAPHPMRRPVRVATTGGTVYVAGDHRDTSSIQGALVSGRRCAEAVLADLP